MVEYNTINAKLSDSQLNKLKSTVKNKQGTALRMSARMVNGNKVPDGKHGKQLRKCNGKQYVN